MLVYPEHESEWQGRPGDQRGEQAPPSLLPPQASGERWQELTVPSIHPRGQETRFWEGSWEEVGEASLSPRGGEINAECLVRVGVGSQQGLSPA